MAKMGGARPGAGRPKGSVDKAKQNRELAIRLAGVTPKEFLLNGMAFYQTRITEELARGAEADKAIIEAAYIAGAEFAKDAAPYCHARLAAITHSGQINSDVDVRDARDRLAHLFAREGAAAGATNGAAGTTH